eukprot:gene12039-15144_t
MSTPLMTASAMHSISMLSFARKGGLGLLSLHAVLTICFFTVPIARLVYKRDYLAAETLILAWSLWQKPAIGALPWGRAPSETKLPASAAEDGDSPNLEVEMEPQSLEDVGLEIGNRIEVKWEIEIDDGQTESKWWGALVKGRARPEEASPSHEPAAALPVPPDTDTANPTATGGTEHDGLGTSTADASAPGSPPPAPGDRLQFEIEYDAYAGFDEELAVVEFITRRTLLDPENGQEMFWRKDGDTWEEDDDDDADDDGEFEDEDDDEDGAGEFDRDIAPVRAVTEAELSRMTVEPVLNYPRQIRRMATCLAHAKSNPSGPPPARVNIFDFAALVVSGGLPEGGDIQALSRVFTISCAEAACTVGTELSEKQLLLVITN